MINSVATTSVALAKGPPSFDIPNTVFDAPNPILADVPWLLSGCISTNTINEMAKINSRTVNKVSILFLPQFSINNLLDYTIITQSRSIKKRGKFLVFILFNYFLIPNLAIKFLYPSKSFLVR